ncbi:MAG: hypothetical protein M1837_000024 [Sclerophora amabilis]|nr:MAG: hypothetical protein M1837_000024 [Sclerophora amabilis]
MTDHPRSTKTENGYPRPLYFVCRENGDLVPLIAVDELPMNVTIHGAPRALGGLNETLNMMSLGTASRALGNYSISVDTPSPHQPSLPVTPASSTKTPDSSHREEGASKATSWRSRSRKSSPRNAQNLQVVSSRRPVADADKEFCTYWIFHGECAFTHSPSGCKFKHEMPTDLETMNRVGLKHLPMWWLDKNGATLTDNNWRTVGPKKALPPPSPCSSASPGYATHNPVPQSVFTSMQTHPMPSLGLNSGYVDADANNDMSANRFRETLELPQSNGNRRQENRTNARDHKKMVPIFRRPETNSSQQPRGFSGHGLSKFSVLSPYVGSQMEDRREEKSRRGSVLTEQSTDRNIGGAVSPRQPVYYFPERRGPDGVSNTTERTQEVARSKSGAIPPPQSSDTGTHQDTSSPRLRDELVNLDA